MHRAPPARAMTGNVMNTDRYGRGEERRTASRPDTFRPVGKSPCAKLTIPLTLKITAMPSAMRAYVPPTRNAPASGLVRTDPCQRPRYRRCARVGRAALRPVVLPTGEITPRPLPTYHATACEREVQILLDAKIVSPFSWSFFSAAKMICENNGESPSDGSSSMRMRGCS